MVKKQAQELKKGDKVRIADQTCIVKSIEISDIGKHGKRKCRIEVITPNKNKMVIIRPADYLFNSD